MGAAGSDVALMADDLAPLPFAVGLSRRTRAVIRQNVFVSLGVVALLVRRRSLGLGIGPAGSVSDGAGLRARRPLLERNSPDSRSHLAAQGVSSMTCRHGADIKCHPRVAFRLG
jgi:Cd2+/Zn2+-exporting ATPase